MPTWSSTDERFMQMAMREAQNAFDQDEIPVGAILVSR
ncbi:MAG TPA: tRNA-specific adenosine deaminase, partial [Chitinophagaceae bacterium]|nr:tRNA-specific adenosine deaminase [Chitinophagaceae bacterium]